jgi:hypothetical protein
VIGAQKVGAQFPSSKSLQREHSYHKFTHGERFLPSHAAVLSAINSNSKISHRQNASQKRTIAVYPVCLNIGPDVDCDSDLTQLPEVRMAKKVLKFPKENTARLRLMAHFADDRNECVSDNVVRAIATTPVKNPTAKKQSQK